MKHRFFDQWALLPFAIIFIGLMWVSSAPCDRQGTSETQVKPRFIAYYFFTNVRCSTCRRIEQWAREAINENFKDQIASGQLQWHALNVEIPENKHFIEDFQLYTKSVVVAEYHDGRPVRWVNLKDVWKLNRDRQKYFEYLARETKSFMEKN